MLSIQSLAPPDFNESRYLDNNIHLLTTNGEAMQQSLIMPFRNLSNDLRSVSPVGSHLVEFMSFVSYDHSPQQLQVSPGRFGQVLSNGEQAESLRQELDIKRFFADHSAGFIKIFRLLSATATPSSRSSIRSATFSASATITSFTATRCSPTAPPYCKPSNNQTQGTCTP